MLFIAPLVPRRDGWTMDQDQSPYESDKEAVPIKQEDGTYHV